MNLTTNEIKDIIKIARRFPDMSAEDIINSIVEGYSIKTGLQRLMHNIKSLFEDKKPTSRPQVSEILQIICIYHKQPISEVKSKSRKSEFVKVRQQYCLIATLFRHSQETMSEEINRDHSTVHNSKSRALWHCEKEKEYMDEVKNIINHFPKYKTSLFQRLELFMRNPQIRQYGT